VKSSAESLPFLRSDLARELVEERLLVGFSLDEHLRLVSSQVPFVTYPFEWCDLQFQAAALLTLDVSARILQLGYELKDASAWNVIFDGRAAIFCDHLSFRSIEEQRWWAFGQFARHFLLPLAVSKSTGLACQSSFLLASDGLSPVHVRRLLGLGRYRTRVWPLLLHDPRHARAPKLAVQRAATNQSDTYHRGLYAYASWALRAKKSLASRSEWHRYAENREHYSDAALAMKRETVRLWLGEIAARWVVDLGCNNGEFAKLASEEGANVIAIDSDHDCVEAVYSMRAGPGLVYPVLANLSDMSGGRGWLGRERPSLLERMRGIADVVMALAIVHHLAVSESIPFDRIVDFLAELTGSYCIVEFVGDGDALLGVLAAARRRQPSEFYEGLQRACFLKRFCIVKEVLLSDSGRSLALMRKIS